MATQTLPQVAPQSTIALQRHVLQSQLVRILWLQRQVEAFQAELDKAQSDVRTDLEAGTRVEPGPLRAMLKTFERRTVAWKAVVERELGEAYAKRVLAATKPETYTKLVVEE